MYGWIDTELARQRRVELLLEAEGRWRGRALRGSGSRRLSLFRRLQLLLRSPQGVR